MQDAGLNPVQLAGRIGCTPRSVEGWITGDHTPYTATRRELADLLKVDEMTLFPEAARRLLKTGPDREIRHTYPNRSGMPVSVWQRILDEARHEFVYSAYSITILWTLIPDATERLRARAEEGCRVRLIIGDPTDPLTTADEATTGVPLKLSTRIEQSQFLLEPLRDVVQVRQSPLGYGRSVFRGDDEALLAIWPHGIWGGDYPVLHLRRMQDGGVFDQMAVRHIEALWRDSTPVWPEPEQPPPSG
jgi:hypothetical protein